MEITSKTQNSAPKNILIAGRNTQEIKERILEFPKKRIFRPRSSELNYMQNTSS